MANIGEATGSAINALPIDKMIAGPLMAAISAQVQASHAYKDFIETVGLEEGKPVMIPFTFIDEVVDGEGNKTGRTVTRQMEVPLLALVSHPNLNIDKVDIDFEMTISTSEEQKSSTAAEASLTGKMGWGPFSVTIKGSVSHKTEQTRKTDTRAKYSIKVSASRTGPPEGMMRVLDTLLNAAQPRVVADTGTPSKAPLTPATAATTPGGDKK